MKILDFGIAKLLADGAQTEDPHGLADGDAPLHVAGAVQGTLARSITGPTSTRSAASCSSS